MKKSIKLITNLTLSFLIGFISIGSSLNNVYASEDSNTYKITIDSELAYKFSELNEVASKSYDLKNTEEINNYIMLAKSSINNNEVLLNSNINYLNFEKVNVVKSNINGSTYTSVNIAINGEYSLLSNLNLIFNDNNELLTYTETLIYNNEKTNKFIVDTYQNGKILESNQTDLPYIDDAKIQEGIDGLKASFNPSPFRGWKATTACIAGVATMGTGNIAGVIACFRLL